MNVEHLVEQYQLKCPWGLFQLNAITFGSNVDLSSYNVTANYCSPISGLIENAKINDMHISQVASHNSLDFAENILMVCISFMNRHD